MRIVFENEDEYYEIMERISWALNAAEEMHEASDDDDFDADANWDAIHYVLDVFNEAADEKILADEYRNKTAC
jgi:hypothetical protein